LQKQDSKRNERSSSPANLNIAASKEETKEPVSELEETDGKSNSVQKDLLKKSSQKKYLA
jgi:hypothetical protein